MAHVLDIKQGKRLKVEVALCSPSELQSIDDFEFDWDNESAFEVYKLSISKTNKTLGLMSLERVSEELRIEIRLLEICTSNVGKNKTYDRIAGVLIAYACKEAFFSGFYGFVSLVPKTNLIEHYQSKYGFEQFGRHLAVQLESSEKLMNEYLLDEKD